VKAIHDWVTGSPRLLAIRAPSPKEMVDVFVAWIHTLPPDEANSVVSRAIIVDDVETWKVLASSSEPLILVSGSNLARSPELFAEAKRKGHHVLRFSPFTDPKTPEIVELEPMRVHDLKTALQKAGIEERDAARLAEGSGGSFTVFRRQFNSNVGIERPEWADGAQAQDLSSLLLAAAWNQGNPDDCRILERLAGKPYTDVERLAKQLLIVTDPPLRRVLAIWEFVSPLDAWTLLHHSLTSSQVDAFESVIIEVLSENDPALDLAPEERLIAPLHGKRRKYSDHLRRGLAEILALSASLASESGITGEHDFSGRARRIASRLLAPASGWKRWASIGNLLPLLSEAAPEEFLDAVTDDLKSPKPDLPELLRNDTGYHTGLLWALEALAWSPKYAAKVAELLAKLAELDPGGKWANRPDASLRNLFFSWRPQTMATFEQLLAILRRLTEKYQAIAWKLLVGLLPQRHSFMMDSYKPSAWRSWTAGWTGQVLQADYLKYISGIVDLALKLASGDPGRWLELLDQCTALLPQDRARVFSGLEQIDPVTLDKEQRLSVWESLRDLVQKHAAFHDADWALPKEETARLAKIRDRFTPEDEVQIAAPLFDEKQMMYESPGLPYEEREARLRDQRQSAVERVWKTTGLPGVMALARKVKNSWQVGLAFAAAKGSEPEADIIPGLLLYEDRKIASFAVAYASSRINTEGPDWVERFPSTQWSADQVAAFACLMPFNSRTWNWVETAGSNVKREYWAKVRDWMIPPEPTQLEIGARKLLEAERPSAAISLLAAGMYSKMSIPSALVLEVLEAMCSAKEEEWRTLETYYAQTFLERLQQEGQTDETRLAKLEFGLLPILGKYTLRPQTLERVLAKDPGFFIECLKILYRPRHQAEGTERSEGDPHDAQKARLVWRLFAEWQHLPGTQEDGSISLDELREWILATRAAARDADRIEVCDVTIGQIFSRAPGDEKGIKPCVPVRDIIEQSESDEIERGFTTGLYNLRGVVSKGVFEGGQQERDLALEYERYAQACETTWPRTATALRSLVEIYQREAELADAEARLRE